MSERGKRFWSLALIILSLNLSLSSLKAAEQFQLGDNLSIYSDKAFRREGGDVFEAVGNVVVVSGKDTLYGESASFDRRSLTFKVEGNVRFITEEMTLYGSHLEYHALTGYADIQSARILNPQFNIVAQRIQRQTDKVIEATEAEFTACRDCTESWAVFGKKILIHLQDKAVIYNGLTKIKGVSVLYLPYMVIPLSKRKSGLLFPNISSREGEGLTMEQPLFWAIDEDKDATFTPTFWGKRGYGMDGEFRQKFSKTNWFNTNIRLLNDKIYEPNTKSQNLETNYTRYFSEFESHKQWSPSTVHHFRYTGTRDLDIVRDHPLYTDERVLGSDFGFNGFVDTRGSKWSLSLQAEYSRNQLFSDASKFDRSYVQTLPRVSFGTTPLTLHQGKGNLLRHISAGVDTSLTRFRSVVGGEKSVLRDADRFTAAPYLNAHLFNWGPLAFKTEANLDFQRYRFSEVRENEYAEKSAVLIRNEMSFSMDRIFGLAYEEKVPTNELSREELDAIKGTQREIQPLATREKETNLIGTLPDFEKSLTEEMLLVPRHSYRHAQEFKFVHHYISNENLSGNSTFKEQIRTNTGWFDYTDAIRSQEYLLGSNITRTIIPPSNTLEFQWNNVLIKKEPKNTDWRQDQRYLRDNFSYSKMSYFNVSQGYIFDKEFIDVRDRLTRLAVQGGFIARRWSLSFSDYFFHRNSQHIFQTTWQRQFDYFNLLTSYNYNSFSDQGNSAKLNNLTAALQVRPFDTLGLTYARQIDLEAQSDIRSVYVVDIMPHNNCWILNLSYESGLLQNRYALNILFNFGDNRFANYKRDWFRTQRF
jgi:LPS-assembly protein